MNESCLKIEPLLAAYALDALDIDEKRQVEAHLDSCAFCLQAVTDYQAISDGLRGALPPTQPSARVRANLLAQTASKAHKTGWLEQLRDRRPKLILVTAIIAILVLVVFNINLLRSTNQILKFQETLSQENQVSQTVFALMTYPESEVVVIDDGDIYGTLIYDPDGHLAVLNVWGLEILPEGQDYQVWLIEPDQTRVSGGVFQSSKQTEYVSFLIESPISIESFTGMGVTIEPAGGSSGPTGPRIFGVGL